MKEKDWFVWVFNIWMIILMVCLAAAIVKETISFVFFKGTL